MKHTIALLALCVLSALCNPAAAQPVTYPSLAQPAAVKKTGKNDVAIIVAVENYVFLPPVKGALTNAADWETFFKSSLGVGKVHMLVDRQATREQLERFARTAAQEAKAGGTVWFVFIGHGSPSKTGDDGLLVGVDAQQDPDSLFARGFGQQHLLELLNAGKQEQTVVIVDACFSGRDNNGQALAPAQPVIPTLSTPKLAQKTVILSAAQASEFAGALPGEDRPAFSYLLLGALRGWSKDKGGDINANDALTFTQRSLRGLPGRFQQTPGLYGDDKLVLVRGTKEKDPGVADMMRRHRNPSFGDLVGNMTNNTACEPGKARSIDTDGNCCWPGQAWNGTSCIGIPTQCPTGTVANPQTQSCDAPACETGMQRPAGKTQCCWPEQTYAAGRGMCVGVPACPSGTRVDGEQCLPNDPAAWYQNTCKNGDPIGCLKLGRIKNTQTNPDTVQAAQLFDDACAANVGAACTEIGFMLETGRGVTTNIARAAAMYVKACDLNDMYGCNNLGVLNREGRGVPRDHAKALRLFQQACEVSNPHGCGNLGFAHEIGQGVAPNLVQAAKLYEQACNLNEPHSCNNLSLLNRDGRGVTKDLDRAQNYAEKACNLGHPGGCTNLGYLAETGLIGPANLAQASQLYEKACNLGETYGCNNLGVLFRDGRGKTQDFNRARGLFEKACSNGNALACTNLGYMYDVGQGLNVDVARARQLYEQACAGNDPTGCNNMGHFFEHGRGVTQDPNRSRDFYQKSCNLGHAPACAKIR